MRSLGFEPVSWESLNGRFSIFDRYYNFEHAQHVAEWKRDCGQLLGFIADSVVSRLSDAVPDIGDRLWSALLTFDQAETTEQLSQVAEIDLVCASTDALNEQIAKLLAVAQKGIYAEMYRAETRRCPLRTILLLDDLVALKQGAFQIRPDLDFGPFLSERR